jgi:four helix bundle protein
VPCARPGTAIVAPGDATGQALSGGSRCAFTSGTASLMSFRELLVWQKAMSIAERCYRMSKRFGRDDQLVLGFELRKSCVSVPSNIAEGFGRHYTAAYVNHLWIANGSNNELQTQLEVGRRVEVVTEKEAETIIVDSEEVGRMLRGLVGSLERGTMDRRR